MRGQMKGPGVRIVPGTMIGLEILIGVGRTCRAGTSRTEKLLLCQIFRMLHPRLNPGKASLPRVHSRSCHLIKCPILNLAKVFSPGHPDRVIRPAHLVAVVRVIRPDHLVVARAIRPVHLVGPRVISPAHLVGVRVIRPGHLEAAKVIKLGLLPVRGIRQVHLVANGTRVVHLVGRGIRRVHLAPLVGRGIRQVRPVHQVGRVIRQVLPLTRGTREVLPLIKVTRPALPAARDTSPSLPAARDTSPPLPAARGTSSPLPVARDISPALPEGRGINQDPMSARHIRLVRGIKPVLLAARAIQWVVSRAAPTLFMQVIKVLPPVALPTPKMAIQLIKATSAVTGKEAAVWDFSPRMRAPPTRLEMFLEETSKSKYPA